jgi:hypothetical protein
MRVLVDGFQKDYPSMVSQLAWSPDEKSATAKGRGFKAAFSVSETEIVVRVDLSMLLGAMKGRVKARLEEKLDTAVSP